MASTKSKKTAVIIKGNPRWIRNSPDAAAFYSRLRNLLKSRGYSVSFDAGKPHTTPKAADLWIGHSRGADRLRFAPKGTKTLSIGSPVAGAINHPEDSARFAKGGYLGKPPGRGHYKITGNMMSKLKTAHVSSMRDEFEKIAATAALRIIRGLIAAGKNAQAERLAAQLISKGRAANLPKMGPMTSRQARIAELRKKLGITRATDPRKTRGLKVTEQGSQAKFLGAGAEGPAHLMVGAKAGLKANPGGFAVRKTYDTATPMFSMPDLVRKHNIHRRLSSQSGHPSSLAKLIEGTGPVKGGVARLLSPKLHRGKGGSRYTLSEYVRGKPVGAFQGTRHDAALGRATEGMSIAVGGGPRVVRGGKTVGRRDGVVIGDLARHPDNALVARYNTQTGAPSLVKAVDFSTGTMSPKRLKIPKAWGKPGSHIKREQVAALGNNPAKTVFVTRNPNIANYITRRVESLRAPQRHRYGPENMAKIDAQNDARFVANRLLQRKGTLREGAPGTRMVSGRVSHTINPFGEANKRRALSGLSAPSKRTVSGKARKAGSEDFLQITKQQRPAFESALKARKKVMADRGSSSTVRRIPVRQRDIARPTEAHARTLAPGQRVVSGGNVSLTRAGAGAKSRAKGLVAKARAKAKSIMDRFRNLRKRRANRNTASQVVTPGTGSFGRQRTVSQAGPISKTQSSGPPVHRKSQWNFSDTLG